MFTFPIIPCVSVFVRCYVPPVLLGWEIILCLSSIDSEAAALDLCWSDRIWVCGVLRRPAGLCIFPSLPSILLICMQMFTRGYGPLIFAFAICRWWKAWLLKTMCTYTQTENLSMLQSLTFRFYINIPVDLLTTDDGSTVSSAGPRG